MSLRRSDLPSPDIASAVFVAPNAVVIGDVRLGARASVWFNAVLRGDVEAIEVGEDTNVQDGVVLHTDPGAPLRIGSRVTIGHGAILHGCTVGDDALIGIGAIVLDGAVIGRHCIVGAGSVVPPGRHLPDGSLSMGSPARVVRELRPDELDMINASWKHYVQAGGVASGDGKAIKGPPK